MNKLVTNPTFTHCPNCGCKGLVKSAYHENWLYCACCTAYSRAQLRTSASLRPRAQGNAPGLLRVGDVASCDDGTGIVIALTPQWTIIRDVSGEEYAVHVDDDIWFPSHKDEVDIETELDEVTR